MPGGVYTSRGSPSSGAGGPQATLRDHALLLEFLQKRDGEGAEHAMAIHLRHAMDEMGLELDRLPAGPG